MKPFPHVNKRSDHGEIQEATGMGSSIDEGHHFFNSAQLKDKDERERQREMQAITSRPLINISIAPQEQPLGGEKDR